MSRLVIRCDSRGAFSDDLEAWLEQQAGRLARRADERARVSRLTHQRTGGKQQAAWLLEVERDGPGAPAIDGETLADLFRDMRLVGLEPRLLKPDGQETRASA